MNLGFILYPLCHSCGIPFVLMRFLLAIIIASEGLYEHESYSLHSSFVRQLLLPACMFCLLGFVGNRSSPNELVLVIWCEWCSVV